MDEKIKKANDLDQNSVISNQQNNHFEFPEIISEDLLAFGAICNGSSAGGRKDSVAAPQFCNAARLYS